jgi:hypothetical protein
MKVQSSILPPRQGGVIKKYPFAGLKCVKTAQSAPLSRSLENNFDDLDVKKYLSFWHHAC